MGDYLHDVAIIGAGLGGCALAIALSAHKIPVTVYESRLADHDLFHSGVVLTPNSLHILDRLGILARIQDRCHMTTHRVFKNRNDETVRKTLITNESLYGYPNHRLWRRVLLDEMRQILAERLININYGSKFNGLISDHSSGVTFLINDVRYQASLLIGSDGIYSSVRKHIAPDIGPYYTGTVGVLAHIKRDSVSWPYDDYERNATIQDKPGALFFIPEDPQAEDIMIGMQVQCPEQSRADLEQLQADKEKLLEFYTRRYDEWGSTARSIIDQIGKTKESCFIWPYLRMPALQRWYSDSGRVIIVGDGAHALPPSSGQGVNQALEDVYSLTLLLTSIDRESAHANGVPEAAEHQSRAVVLDVLAFWQQMRQKRIDAIFDWATNNTNVQRLPAADRERLIAEGKFKEGKVEERDDMSWLYRPNIEEEVNKWVSSRQRGRRRASTEY